MFQIKLFYGKILFIAKEKTSPESTHIDVLKHVLEKPASVVIARLHGQCQWSPWTIM